MKKGLKISLLTIVTIVMLISMGSFISYANCNDSVSASSGIETKAGTTNKAKRKKNKFSAIKSWLKGDKDENNSNISNDVNDDNSEVKNNDLNGSSSDTTDNSNSANVGELSDVSKAEYNSYYTNVKKSNKGIIIMGSAMVSGNTLNIAGSMIDKMLAKEGTGIAEKMTENNAKLAIFGKGENAFSIPEHSSFYSENLLYVEGLGGTMNVPVSSITESNVLRLTSGDYVTKYPNENILVHEFAHAIQLIGVDQLADKSLYNEFNAAYENAKANNLFPNTYAISNREEFFATTSAIWFNLMDESVDGSWDGTRGPVNTREELKSYDRKTYDFLEKIYPEDDFLSKEWSSGVPNKFSVK